MIHSDFVTKATARRLPDARPRFRGRVFLGREARRGLVDRIGGLDDAMEAASAAGIKPTEGARWSIEAGFFKLPKFLEA
jgi:ClpP class serine protease